MARFFSFLIIAFWLITSALLIQMVYFPDDSRFSEENPQKILAIFVDRQEQEDLDIYSGRKIVGNLAVLPRKLQGGLVRIAMNGSIDVDLAGVEGKVALTSKLTLSPEGQLEYYTLAIGMKSLGIICELSQGKSDEKVNYVVHHRDQVLLDSSDPAASMAARLQGQLLLQAWGIDLAGIQRQMEEKKKAGEDEEVKVTARRGVITVKGIRLKGYTVTAKVLGDAELTFFFSEDGELMKMDSFLDYRLVNYKLRLTEDQKLRYDGTAPDIIVEEPDGSELLNPNESTESSAND